MSEDPMSEERFAADHADFDELAVGWALHALEPEDEAVFAAHLPSCPRCAATVAETHEVMAAMARDLPPAEPSEGLRHRLHAAVAATGQVHRPVPPPVPAPAAPVAPRTEPERDRPAWQRRLPTALVAAAVAAVLGLGVWNVYLAESRDRLQSTVAEQSRVMDHLLTAGEATIAPLSQKGQQVATVVARRDGIQVVTNGLAVNDTADTTYVVWGMRVDGAVPLGTFDVVQSHLDVRAVGSERPRPDQYSAYGVSIEHGRQAPPKPTEIVATGEVPR